MIELTQEQLRALGEASKPLQLVNPATQEVYVLVRKDVYDLTCGIVGGRGPVWNDAQDEDLIGKPK